MSSRYLAALLLAFPFTSGAAPVSMTCLVVSIADGDTLTARCGAQGDYQQVKARLAEIDAPQMHSAKTRRLGPLLLGACA